MKRTVWLIIVVLLLSAVSAGCGKDSVRRTESGMEVLPEAKAFAGNPTYSTPEIAPLKPIREETYPAVEIAPLEPIREKPAETKPTEAPKPSQQPRNADWVLNVDDNVTLVTEGIKYHVNLYVSMNKSGGKDVTGTYTGKILYTSTVDEAELARLVEADSDMIFDAGFMNFTMEAVSTSLEVVKFNAKEYTAHSGAASAKADYMAVGVVDMRMRHQSHLWAHDTSGSEGEGWTPDMDITKPIQVRFLINGGKVTAYVGNDPGGESFSGMITGTPR